MHSTVPNTCDSESIKIISKSIGFAPFYVYSVLIQKGHKKAVSVLCLFCIPVCPFNVYSVLGIQNRHIIDVVF